MARIAWKNLRPEVLRAVADLEARGFVEPTIRAVYYVLSDAYGLIPGTPYGYKKLDELVVALRKEGAIPWGFFAVKRGRSDRAGLDVPLPGRKRAATGLFLTPEEWVDYWVRETGRADESFRVHRWHHQRDLVEVWVEKDGLLGATANWLRDLDVTVRAPQGYGAWEFVHAAMADLRTRLETMEDVKTVRIAYLGDADPSGRDIPRFLDKDAIEHFREDLEVDLAFETVALDPDQVRELGLSQGPDSAETLAKIRRDARYAWYVEEWGEVFCELDSLYALRTAEAQALVRGAVERWFDEGRGERTRAFQDEARERVRSLIRERVRFLEGA